MRREGLLRIFKRRWSLLLALLSLIALGVVANVRRNHRRWSAYTDYRATLLAALSQNDFAFPYANPSDLERLRAELGTEVAAPTERETVIRLVEWINSNTKPDEMETVRAVDLLEVRSGACEIHALAVSTLEALGIKARWISGAKSSRRFGYLEAYVDGEGWQLFKLRDPTMSSLGKSAWQLYRESEPDLNIRMFYKMRGQSVRSWNGTVFPAVFPFANVKRHPELEALFTTNRGLSLDDLRFNPHEYVFAWTRQVDNEWVEAGSSMQSFERIYGRLKTRLVSFGFVEVWVSELESPIPTPLTIDVVVP
ncbi:MAG: transglutaminase domain-containing protein [Deltaproteobacteria bacterium]|nr:transglutaminase domain-containing protein [Deltaproteobacteria bacterium]